MSETKLDGAISTSNAQAIISAGESVRGLMSSVGVFVPCAIYIFDMSVPARVGTNGPYIEQQMYEIRSWITSLASYMPAEQRKELAESARGSGFVMVNKKRDSTGRMRVCPILIIGYFKLSP